MNAHNSITIATISCAMLHRGSKLYEKMTDADYIPFFLPPLEYGQTTLTDVDPKAVLNKRRWVMPKAGPNINKALIDNTDKPKKARRVDPSDTSGS